MSSASRVAPKKPYHRPCLKTYGQLQDVTRTVANTANIDGGSGGGMTKTH